eukprot:3546195-Rhodomonas_salina.1
MQCTKRVSRCSAVPEEPRGTLRTARRWQPATRFCTLQPDIFVMVWRTESDLPLQEKTSTQSSVEK